ncbi:hypothetical protein MMC25_004095 [Agyrium rufum]|nr:hypothetical protein [Agyrium rufum]
MSSPASSFLPTCSRKRLSDIPTFPSTSSQELNTLLTTLRKNVFFPSTLTSGQRGLLYRKTQHHHLLGDDPIVVQRGNPPEPFTLLPLNQLYDEPNTKVSFWKILSLMKEPVDWQIWPGLLEGWIGSHRKIPQSWYERLIRQAGEAGQGGIILECLKRTKKTGLRADEVPVVRAALWIGFERAIQSSWSEEGLNKAIKHVENVLHLIEDPNHIRRESKKPMVNAKTGEILDPRMRPEIWGVGMALSATRLNKFPDSSEQKGDIERVNNFAKRVIATWESFKDLEVKAGEDPIAANEKLKPVAPLWFGMRMVEKLNNIDQTSQKTITEILHQQVEPTVSNARDSIQATGKDLRGTARYQILLSIIEG